MGGSVYRNGKTPEERLAFWYNEAGNRRCCKCKQFKSVELFHKDKKSFDGRCMQCAECAKAAGRHHHARRMKEDPEYRQKKRDSYVRAKFGITEKEYWNKLAAQGTKCAICGTSEPVGGWALDHCHTTGKLRDFLCNICNLGLGYFKENEESLMNAVTYLQTHRKEGTSL